MGFKTPDLKTIASLVFWIAIPFYLGLFLLIAGTQELIYHYPLTTDPFMAFLWVFACIWILAASMVMFLIAAFYISDAWDAFKRRKDDL